MTIEELNALYEATDFGNLGNYKAPTTTSNIDLTAPVVEGIPAIQPYTPPFIPIEGEGRPTDTPIDPMSFGNLGIKGYNQLNIAGPVKNSFTDIIGNLYSAYTNISPVHLGIKGVKKIGDFVKEIQKNRKIKKAQEEAAAADVERAAMNAAYASQSQAAIDRQNAVTGGRYDGAGSSAAYGADPTGYSGSSAQGGIQGYGGKSGTPVSQQRRPYGKGGIVTL
jgi:hypothetical protein